MRWEPSQTPPMPETNPATTFVPAPFWTAVKRGLGNHCPYCGVGRVFAGYLKLVPECSHCHAPLGRLRADDAPPYFTIFLVGHVLVPPVFWIEKAYEPPMWLHMVVWLPLFTILCMLLLRPIKGGVVGWMSTLGMDQGADEQANEQAVPLRAVRAVRAPDVAQVSTVARVPDRNA